jgi:hypothetical protein
MPRAKLGRSAAAEHAAPTFEAFLRNLRREGEKRFMIFLLVQELEEPNAHHSSGITLIRKAASRMKRKIANRSERTPVRPWKKSIHRPG